MDRSGDEVRRDSRPAAVIFDMDGVLADTEPLHARCFTAAFAHTGIHATVEDYRRAVTIGGNAAMDFYFSLGGDEADWQRVKVIKDPQMQAALEEGVELMPGVRALVESLRESGIAVALATSARRKSVELILDRLDVWDWFEAVATRNEVEAEKPNPAVFLLAAANLGVNPADCVAIEDSPRGVVAASRAGMKCVAVPTDSTLDGDFAPANMVVHSLEAVSVQNLRELFD